MTLETTRSRVTAADLVRRFGQWQEQAMQRPVYVTHHGRDRLVLLSAAAYAQARARGRGAIAGDEEGAGAADVRVIVEQIAGGFIAFDASLRVTEINPVAAAYLKLVRSEVIGVQLFDRIDGLRRSLIHSYLERAVAAGEIGAFDLPSAAFHGRWLHVRTLPYGEGAACLLRDIGDEIMGRRTADASRTMRSAMAAHGAIGVATLSPRGTFVEIDEGLATMAGFTPDSLMRARMTDILPLNRRVTAAREVETVLAGGSPRAFDSALLVNQGGDKQGGDLAVRIALAALKGDYGCDGAVAVMTRRADDLE